jgi:hypothetical protein
MKAIAQRLGLTEKDLRSAVISLAAYLVAWLVGLLSGSGGPSAELMVLLGPIVNRLRGTQSAGEPPKIGDDPPQPTN